MNIARNRTVPNTIICHQLFIGNLCKTRVIAPVRLTQSLYGITIWKCYDFIHIIVVTACVLQYLTRITPVLIRTIDHWKISSFPSYCILLKGPNFYLTA